MAHWSGPKNSDHSVKSNGTLLKLDWADIIQVSVLPFSIVEHLDVVKDIRLGLLPRPVDLWAYTLLCMAKCDFIL